MGIRVEEAKKKKDAEEKPKELWKTSNQTVSMGIKVEERRQE